MTTTLADELKLEIGLPDEPGDNLLTNTSGQYGAWQWGRADGTSGINITGNPVARTITAQRNNTAGLTAVWTDFLPVTAGMYANARLDLLAITAGHKVTLGLQFYNSAYNVVSYHYSSPSTTLDTLSFSSISIPGSASWARLLVVLDKTTDPIPNNGSANANALVTFTRAMLAELPTAGTPSIVHTNLMPNGGFQHSTTGWAAGTNVASISRVDSGGGAYVLRTESTETTLSDNERSYVNGPYVPIEAGQNYSIRVDVRAPVMTNGHSLTPGLLYRWLNDSNVVIGGDNFLDSPVTDGSWVQFWRVITAPAGATKLRFHPNMQHHGPAILIAAGWSFDVDSVSVVKSSVLMPYWDGDKADTSSYTYAWTGTVGNSPSTRTSVGAVDYVETDEQYIDILHGAAALDIERSELDLSTFTGRLVDVALSPARVGSVVRPGRRFRISGLEADGMTWHRMFTGTLDLPSVAYEPLEDERRAARDPGRALNITITGTGYESKLAQASRPEVTRTPANLADLVLAGAGVPWDINGSTSIVGGVSGIASNENATALDQVALTRDTVSGIAYINAEGTLIFRSSAPSSIVGTLDEDAYTADGLKVSWDPARVINSVTIVRVIRASDGSTEERQHGPYDNAASIKAWGRRSATVTIASVPNDTAQADTRAAAILAANADPELIIEEVSVNSADNRAHAFYELYDLVHARAVTVDGTIETDVRIARIRHEITTERRRHGNWGRWRTTYGFMMAGSIAAPAIQPSPTPSTPELTDLSSSRTNPNGLTYANTTVQTENSRVTFRLRRGIIYVDGIFWPGTTAHAAAMVSNIPEAWRPEWGWRVRAGSNAGVGSYDVDIQTDGDIAILKYAGAPADMAGNYVVVTTSYPARAS